ncbi:hypothetical protein Q3G72_002877 [Acer saccharum]|nr:hypothetical protein Q3G72_002877 [Acer saccharum]
MLTQEEISTHFKSKHPRYYRMCNICNYGFSSRVVLTLEYTSTNGPQDLWAPHASDAHPGRDFYSFQEQASTLLPTFGHLMQVMLTQQDISTHFKSKHPRYYRMCNICNYGFSSRVVLTLEYASTNGPQDLWAPHASDAHPGRDFYSFQEQASTPLPYVQYLQLWFQFKGGLDS